MNIPDFNVFLQKSEKGIDLDFSSCYNLFRMSYGRINGLGKLAVGKQIEQKNEKLGNVLVKCGTDICKEREATKRYALDRYAEIIKDPNVPNEIKAMLADQLIESYDRRLTTDSLVVGVALCVSFVLIAYGIKNTPRFNIKKRV